MSIFKEKADDIRKDILEKTVANIFKISLWIKPGIYGKKYENSNYLKTKSLTESERDKMCGLFVKKMNTFLRNFFQCSTLEIEPVGEGYPPNHFTHIYLRWKIPTKIPTKGKSICVICLKKIIKKRQTFNCGHSFHPKCIGEWMAKEKTCPICRQKIDD